MTDRKQRAWMLWLVFLIVIGSSCGGGSPQVFASGSASTFFLADATVRTEGTIVLEIFAGSDQTFALDALRIDSSAADLQTLPLRVELVSTDLDQWPVVLLAGESATRTVDFVLVGELPTGPEPLSGCPQSVAMTLTVDFVTSEGPWSTTVFLGTNPTCSPCEGDGDTSGVSVLGFEPSWETPLSATLFDITDIAVSASDEVWILGTSAAGDLPITVDPDSARAAPLISPGARIAAGDEPGVLIATNAQLAGGGGEGGSGGTATGGAGGAGGTGSAGGDGGAGETSSSSSGTGGGGGSSLQNTLVVYRLSEDFELLWEHRFDGAALPPSSACCVPTSTSGCAVSPRVEACVCAMDDFCCSMVWDETCVREVEAFGCGSCGLPTAGAPIIAAAGGRVFVGVSGNDGLIMDGVVVDGAPGPASYWVLLDELTGDLLAYRVGMPIGDVAGASDGGFAIAGGDPGGALLLSTVGPDLSPRWDVASSHAGGPALVTAAEDGSVFLYASEGSALSKYDARGLEAWSVHVSTLAARSIAATADGGVVIGARDSGERLDATGVLIASSASGGTTGVPWCTTMPLFAFATRDGHPGFATGTFDPATGALAGLDVGRVQ